jgi:hypothetical protein
MAITSIIKIKENISKEGLLDIHIEDILLGLILTTLLTLKLTDNPSATKRNKILLQHLLLRCRGYFNKYHF